MGVIPVITQRTSFDTVRYAFAILIFINLCTLAILFLYFSFFIALIHTGAPYKRRGRIPPTYIVLNALWPSSQLIFDDFASTNINFVHFVLCNLYIICGPEMLIYNQLLLPNISVFVIEVWS